MHRRFFIASRAGSDCLQRSWPTQREVYPSRTPGNMFTHSVADMATVGRGIWCEPNPRARTRTHTHTQRTNTHTVQIRTHTHTRARAHTHTLTHATNPRHIHAYPRRRIATDLSVLHRREMTMRSVQMAKHGSDLASKVSDQGSSVKEVSYRYLTRSLTCTPATPTHQTSSHP